MDFRGAVKALTGGVWDGPNRVYSDSNPPETLARTPFTLPAGNAPAGQAIDYTPDGKSLRLRAADGTDTLIGPSAGGSSTEASMTVDYADTTPALPTSGLKIFSRHRARRIPSFVGPTGQDSRLQPALFSNNVGWMRSVNNTTTPTNNGLATTWLNNATATPTAVAVASTSFYTSMVRTRAVTPTTAGTGCGVRTSTAQWQHSTTPNLGGYYFVSRFGLNTGAQGTRGFIGLSSQTGAYAPGTDPGTQLNQIGVFWNAAHTTMKFVASGTTAGSTVDLGANFRSDVAAAATNFYEVALYSPSGAGQYGFWSITRLNDGAMLQGTYGTPGGTGAANVPANGLLLAGHVFYGNGTLAAAHSVDVQSLYLESDN